MRKTMRLFIALFVLLGVAPARAGYDARPAEVKTALAVVKEFQGAAAVEKALATYFQARSSCLADLVAIAGSTSQDKQESAWKDRVAKLNTALQQMVDAVNASPFAQTSIGLTFVGAFTAEEGRFINGLDAVGVAPRRDYILANQKNVSEMTAILDQKWNAIFDQDNAIDQHEKAIAEEIMRLMDRALDEADRHRRTLREKLVAGVGGLTVAAKKMEKPINVLTSGLAAVGILTPEQAQAINQAISALKEGEGPLSAYATIFLATNRDYTARALEYRGALYGERGGVFVLFKGLRRDTDEFVRKNDFSLAQQEYRAASDALDSWKGSLYTAGQKSDGAEFAREVLQKMSNHLASTEKTFNEFVSRHKGKFFGPLGPDIREALVETRAWEAAHRSVAGKDLAARLRQWRDEANAFQNVDLSGLTSDDQQVLKNWFRERVVELIRNMDEAARLQERFRNDFDRRDVEGDLN